MPVLPEVPVQGAGRPGMTVGMLGVSYSELQSRQSRHAGRCRCRDSSVSRGLEAVGKNSGSQHFLIILHLRCQLSLLHSHFWLKLSGRISCVPQSLGWFRLIIKVSLDFSLALIVTPFTVYNMLFSAHVFVCVFSFFLVTDLKFQSIWAEKMLDMIPTFLRLLRPVLCPNAVSPRKCSMCT